MQRFSTHVVGLALASGMFSAVGGQAAVAADPVWMLRATTGPTPRWNHAMAYDSIRGVTVLFGGYHGVPNFYGDTWEWNGSTWILRATTGPSPRVGHAMAYDSARGVTVLFGGFSGDDLNRYYYGDTWEWDGSTWSLRVTTGPSPRSDSAMAYDSARGVTVLFGGCNDPDRFGDTWAWDGMVWTLAHPGDPGGTNAPSPRCAHALTYDSGRSATILFGGVYGWPPLGDTWEWDASGWTLRATTGPRARYDHAMTYESARGVSVLFGGTSGANESDTWEWNGQTWTLRDATGPNARYSPAFGYDSARRVAVLFGGYDGTPDNGETWEYGMDCNANGVPDADDIAAGTSADCDTNGIPDECAPYTPKFLGTAGSAGMRCELPLVSGGTEPRWGRIWRLDFHFDCPPSGAPALAWDSTCPGPPSFVPYNGISVMSCTPQGSNLRCTFTPALENAAAYRFDLSALTGSPPGTDVFVVRGLIGDVNNSGIVTGADVSAVNANWGGTNCRADLDESGTVGGADVSAVNANWGHCAP